MKKNVFLLPLFVFLFGCENNDKIIVSSPKTNTTKLKDELTVLNSNSHVFEKIKKGIEINDTYILINTSSNVIQIIDQKASCNCTSVKFSTKTLKPKDSLSVNVKIETKEKGYGNQSTDIIVETNGSKKFYYLQVLFNIIE